MMPIVAGTNLRCVSGCCDCCTRAFSCSGRLRCAILQLSLVLLSAASASVLARSCSSISPRSPLQQQRPLVAYPAAVSYTLDFCLWLGCSVCSCSNCHQLQDSNSTSQTSNLFCASTGRNCRPRAFSCSDSHCCAIIVALSALQRCGCRSCLGCFVCSCSNCCLLCSGCQRCAITSALCARKRYGPCSCVLLLIGRSSNCRQLQDFYPTSQTPTLLCTPRCCDCRTRAFSCSGRLRCAILQLSLVLLFAASASVPARSCSSICLRSPLQQQWPLVACPAAVSYTCDFCLWLGCSVCSCSNCCQLQHSNPTSQISNPFCASTGRNCRPRAFSCSDSALFDVAIFVLVCSWLTYNNLPLAGLIPSRVAMRLLPPPLALFDVALRVLVCSWPIYNNPSLAGLIPSRVVLRLLFFRFALFDVALRVLVCSWPIYNNPPLAGLITTSHVTSHTLTPHTCNPVCVAEVDGNKKCKEKRHTSHVTRHTSHSHFIRHTSR